MPRPEVLPHHCYYWHAALHEPPLQPRRCRFREIRIKYYIYMIASLHMFTGGCAGDLLFAGRLDRMHNAASLAFHFHDDDDNGHHGSGFLLLFTRAFSQ